MKLNFIVLLLILMSVSLLSAQTPLLINFGPNAPTSTNLTDDPFHAATGSSFSSDTTWNTSGVGGLSSLKYGDGTTATGITLTTGEGSGTSITFGTNPSSSSALGASTRFSNPSVFVASSGTTPVTGGIFESLGNNTEQTSVGLSISGLAAGTYDVYLVGANTSSNYTPANSTAAEEFWANATLATPGIVNTGTLGTGTVDQNEFPESQTWVAGTDYVELSVTLTAGQVLNIYGTGDGTGTSAELRAFFNSIQIVPTLPPGPMNPANMPSYGEWTSSMIGGGGWIQNVVFTANPQRLYAWVDVGGFYRSDDGGQNWYMEHGNLPNIAGSSEVRGLVADPSNPDHILVACGDEFLPAMGIYESTDGGATFNQTPNLPARFAGNAPNRQDGFILVRDPNNSNVLLAGSFGNGIFRSTDGGNTWALSGTNTENINFTDVKIDKNNSSMAYACAETETATSPALSGGFYVSSNNGQTWTMQSNTSPAEIAQDPVRTSPSRFYGTFNTYPVTINGVTTGTTTGTLSYSDNGGGNWTATSGLPNNVNYRAIAASTGTMVLSNTNGNFYTLASGQTAWTALPVVTPSHVDYRGWTWATPRTMFGANTSSISIDPANPSHWFITGAFAIYQTIDAGADWWLSVDGVEATVIQSLCQDPSTGRVHLGMNDNAYLNSVDGGTSFQSSWINLIYNVKDIELSPNLPSRVYMVCGEGDVSNQIYYSTASGAPGTWTKSPMTGLPANAYFQTIAVSPTNANECFLSVAGNIASGAGGPYHSTDGGLTWTWLGAGLPADTWFFYYPTNYWLPGRQIATGPGTSAGCSVSIIRNYQTGSAYTLNRSTMTWAAMAAPPDAPTSIVADPNLSGAWLMSSPTGIYRVLNGTVSHTFSGETVTSLAADMATPGRFAASCKDGIRISTDSGVTWTDLLDTALPNKLASNPLAFSGNRLVVGSGGSGVFWINL